MKLESIIKKGKIIALAGLMYLTMGCATSKFYIEPKGGVIIPLAEKEQVYEPSAVIGAACGLNGKRFGIEAGSNYFHSSEEYIKTHSTLSKINLNFNLLKPTAKVKPYLIGGISFLSEYSTIEIPEFNVHDKVANTTNGLEFGIGVTIIDRIDGRITYMTMPESENVKGMVSATLSYRFGRKR